MPLEEGEEMRFDESKVIINPDLLVHGKTYFVGAMYKSFRYNVEHEKDSVTYDCLDWSDTPRDTNYRYWQFWYPAEYDMESYVPYDAVDFGWVGKSVFASDGESASIIDKVTAKGSGSPYDNQVKVDGEWMSLAWFFLHYNWNDGKPCGCTKKEG